MTLKTKLILFAIFSFIILSSVFGFYFSKFGSLGLSNNQELWGQFGDFVGGTLNPILAFLSFMALLYTIKIQMDELKLSREELEATREELKGSRIAQQEQSESLKLQNEATKLQIFESTFFQLISVFIELKRDITSNKKERVNGLVGKDFKSDSVIITLNSIETISSFVKEINDKYLGNYNDFNKDYEAITGSYFGQVYQIIKFIDTSNIEKKEKYSDIFRAQFTKNELELLFYHCLGTIGKRKFKKLVEDYEFFEHIILNDNIKKQLLEYDMKAFGKNENILKLFE
jgi:hypothetical protein